MSEREPGLAVEKAGDLGTLVFDVTAPEADGRRPTGHRRRAGHRRRRAEEDASVV